MIVWRLIFFFGTFFGIQLAYPYAIEYYGLYPLFRTAVNSLIGAGVTAILYYLWENRKDGTRTDD